MLIADNIKCDAPIRNSTDIRKEINKSDNLGKKVKLAYKLPLGGVAVHFNSKEDKEEFQNQKKIEVFGEESCWHNPNVIRL